MFSYDITHYTCTPSSYYIAWDCPSRCTLFLYQIDSVLVRWRGPHARGVVFFLVPALSQHACIHVAASVLYCGCKNLVLAFCRVLNRYSDAFASTLYITLPRKITGILVRIGHHSVACCLFTHTPPPSLITSSRNTQQSAVANVAPYEDSSARDS